MLSSPDLGRAGERIAAQFLHAHGLKVLASNVAVGRGELDLVALDGTIRVAVEVRTRIGGDDPIDAIDTSKRRQVLRLASQVGASRTDLIGIRMDPKGVDVHWVPAVSELTG